MFFSATVLAIVYMIDEKVQIDSSSSPGFSVMETRYSEVVGIRLGCVNVWELRRLVDCRVSETVSSMNEKQELLSLKTIWAKYFALV